MQWSWIKVSSLKYDTVREKGLKRQRSYGTLPYCLLQKWIIVSLGIKESWYPGPLLSCLLHSWIIFLISLLSVLESIQGYVCWHMRQKVKMAVNINAQSGYKLRKSQNRAVCGFPETCEVYHISWCKCCTLKTDAPRGGILARINKSSQWSKWSALSCGLVTTTGFPHLKLGQEKQLAAVQW